MMDILATVNWEYFSIGLLIGFAAVALGGRK